MPTRSWLSVVAVLIVMLTVSPCDAQSRRAWWLTVLFEPVDTLVASIPLARIDTEMSRVLMLSMDVMPPDATDDPSLLVRSTVDFAHQGDFNDDGVDDWAMVGVYEGAGGNTGRFLVILTANGNGWEPAFRLLDPGELGFSVLSLRGSALIWSKCMECDTWRGIFWNDREYEVVNSWDL